MKILIYILLFSFTTIYSAELTDIKISPLNRAYLFFSELPEYSADLNENKSRITLNLKNTDLKIINQLNSTGVIKSISPINKDNKSIVIIDFSSNGKGFTITPLPYSKSLMIDIFDWDRLTKEETAYRQALFAFESNLDNSEDELKKAVELGSKNANAILALYYLKKDKLEDAIPYLFTSNKDSITIPDIFAGISEVLEVKGEDSIRMDYLQKFKSFTGLSSFSKFAINYNKDQINIPDYFYAKSSSQNSEQPVISSSNSNTLSRDSTNLNTNNSESEQSLLEQLGFSPKYLLFVGIASILLLAFLYWTYTKWKKDQISKINQMSKTKFDEAIRQAKIKSDKKADEIKNERESKQKTNSKNIPKNLINKKYNSSNDDIVLPDLKQKKVKPVVNVKEEKKQSEIEKFLETYIPAKKEIEKGEENKINTDDYIVDSEERSSKSASTDLAMKLANEKHKKKQEQLKKIVEDKTSSDRTNIDNDAKNMGVEKSSLETKNSINKLTDDNERLKKLSDKFNINPDSGKDNDSE
ncbi:hypothetical protein OAQ99_00045 [Candidatus Kapabacteria bacterium]|nr:hypothetical protein [Candidatus Kapabacteria bacterium]